MAITAIDAVIADVVFVAELDRLAARDTNLRHIGLPVNCSQSSYDDQDESCAPE